MQRVVVLGASGFIGRALVARLAGEGISVTAVARRPEVIVAGVATVGIGDLSPTTDLMPLLEGAHSLVHLASRAHKPDGRGAATDWIELEAETARHVAASAARRRLRQIVLLSSAKVHADATHGAALRADQPLAPTDAYGQAKARMERGMTAALQGSETALAIVRPPLVYGPGVKANFLALLRLVRRAPVLPLGAISNRRSFLYIGNLIDLLSGLLARSDGVNGAFLARDDEDLSTPELIRRLGQQLGRIPTLLPAPVWLLRFAAAALGRSEAVARLTESLVLDDRATRVMLPWKPRHGVDEGLGAACRWFLEQERSAG